jgi:hypothetical protein
MNNLSLNNDLPIDPSQQTDSQIIDREIVESHNISLLEEKLIVKRQKQKVGEVIVRKEIETRMIHLPIRREKLIIEKAGITTEQLAEINLGEEKVNGVKFGDLENATDVYQSQSNFISLEALQKLLAEIANSSTLNNVKVRLEIISDRPEDQKSYQDICNQYI